MPVTSVHTLCALLFAAALEAYGEVHTLPWTQANATSAVHAGDQHAHNRTDTALTIGSRVSTFVKQLPTLKNLVIFTCVFGALLLTCLVLRVYRSGRKVRKTRKYDIITTPAERIEMAPLNEENEDEEDSTLFDIKYR
ncbi:membrane protein FAM174B-like [Scleropages formosus]|uniref:Membrane protein FAM174B-like n=1 Tax=Scleropages formosus TaxID=113540 RepID=A0A0P7WJJ9_SCLFO|nr:membrane protein FAM174B-like [Scleropages formosus]KPP63898.1 membrane protein FAM174B-like [Scleropages formosus]